MGELYTKLKNGTLNTTEPAKNESCLSVEDWFDKNKNMITSKEKAIKFVKNKYILPDQFDLDRMYNSSPSDFYEEKIQIEIKDILDPDWRDKRNKELMEISKKLKDKRKG
jgi:hypothetical protein